MSVSVIDPIQQAWVRMMLVCFRPFNLAKWFGLGFCAWLATLGEGGSFNPGGNSGGGGRGGSGGSGGTEVMRFLHDYLAWIIAGVIILVLLVIALGVLLAWLKARGQFMFTDGVVHNRGLVVQPWREYRAQGNALFVFNLVLGLILLVVFLVAAGLLLLLAWPDISARHFGVLAVAAIILGLMLVLGFMVIGIAIRIVVDVFVIPLMYLRRTTVGPAWHEFRTKMLPGHLGAIILFALMSLVLGMAGGIAFLLLGVLTCCIGCCLMMLPYLSAVFMLPMLVFMRSYALYFFQQFGPEYQIMPGELPRGFPVIPMPPQ